MSDAAAEGLECASTTTTSFERTKTAALQLTCACGCACAKKMPPATGCKSKRLPSAVGAAAFAQAARCHASSSADAPASVVPVSMRRKSRREPGSTWLCCVGLCECACECEWVCALLHMAEFS